MRAWLYDTLKNYPELLAYHSGSVFPREALTSANPQAVPRPFLVYGLGNSTAEGLISDGVGEQDAERQFFTIWVHDKPASYARIDEIVPIVKRALVHLSSPADDVMTIRWLETSREFDDKTLGTIHRYIRFQAIRSGRTQ